MKLTHSDLCALAVKWLRMRKQNNCIPYAKTCKVVASEVKSLNFEIPDAIGFNSDGYSILFECKTNLQDFIRDAHKPNRELGGMGDFRIFLTEKGMLNSEIQRHYYGWGVMETDGKKFDFKVFPIHLTANKIAEQRLLLSIIRNPNRKGIWLK
jgi:hypothetical protein